MRAEQAGLENMGCLFLGGPVLLGIIGGVLRHFTKADRRPEYRRLISLMVEFASGVDRSAGSVGQIQGILTRTFAHSHEHQELASAVASFAPGGSAPFHDEAWLAGTFRAFLQERGVLVPVQAGERLRLGRKRKPKNIGCAVLTVAACALAVWLVCTATGYYLDCQSVSADVVNLSGHPLRQVWVECAGPDGRRRQDLGEIAPDARCTARFLVRYEGGSRWQPSFGATYGVTLHYVKGAGRVMSSQTETRNRGSYAEFQVGAGGYIYYLPGQT